MKDNRSEFRKQFDFAYPKVGHNNADVVDKPDDNNIEIGKQNAFTQGSNFLCIAKYANKEIKPIIFSLVPSSPYYVSSEELTSLDKSAQIIRFLWFKVAPSGKFIAFLFNTKTGNQTREYGTIPNFMENQSHMTYSEFFVMVANIIIKN